KRGPVRARGWGAPRGPLPPGPGARMEKTTETWVPGPDRLVSTTRRDACVVHIYPTGPGMGTRYALSDTPVVLGRGNDCDIRINDHSVSRRHARIQPGADGYYAVDLQSTNGTFVNDVPVSICKLKDGDYLRVGNCIYRYLAGGNVEAGRSYLLATAGRSSRSSCPRRTSGERSRSPNDCGSSSSSTASSTRARAIRRRSASAWPPPAATRT